MARIIGFMSFVFVFFVGISTTANADGHLDGYTAELSGANEVDDPDDPEGTGEASVATDSNTSVACFVITFDGIEDPVAAHIHQGAVDANGVVVDFDWENNPGEGCVTADPAVVCKILANPSGYYGNIHTPEFPAGAIRGQLVEAVGGTPAGALVESGELPLTGSSLTLFLLARVAAVIVGGAIVYISRDGPLNTRT